MSIEKELNKLGWTYNKDLKTWENVDTRCVEVDDDFDSVYLDIFCYNNGEYKITFLTLEEMTLFSQLFKMSNVNRFEYISTSAKDFDLPTRATKHSSGYDFHSPIDCVIGPGETTFFSLEVKCSIKDNEFLMVVPRSSLGFKGTNHITLTNTVGIIDSDYYNNPSNEGVIGLKLHNFGPEPFIIHKNDKVVQGIFVKFDTTDDDNVNNERIGGFGSTDTKN